MNKKHILVYFYILAKKACKGESVKCKVCNQYTGKWELLKHDIESIDDTCSNGKIYIYILIYVGMFLQYSRVWYIIFSNVLFS